MAITLLLLLIVNPIQRPVPPGAYARKFPFGQSAFLREGLVT
jgi:hypothetical protein